MDGFDQQQLSEADGEMGGSMAGLICEIGRAVQASVGGLRVLVVVHGGTLHTACPILSYPPSSTELDQWPPHFEPWRKSLVSRSKRRPGRGVKACRLHVHVPTLFARSSRPACIITLLCTLPSRDRHLHPRIDRTPCSCQLHTRFA